MYQKILICLINIGTMILNFIKNITPGSSLLNMTCLIIIIFDVSK